MGAPEMGEGGAAEGGAAPAEIVRNTDSGPGFAATGAAELAMQDIWQRTRSRSTRNESANRAPTTTRPN